MNNLNLIFKQTRDTKRTFVYSECDSGGTPFDDPQHDGAVGTLYLKKTAVGQTPPASLRVTISEVE